jgi:hypothetical protein
MALLITGLCALVTGCDPAYQRFLNFSGETITVKHTGDHGTLNPNSCQLVPGSGLSSRYKQMNINWLDITDSHGHTVRFSDEDLSKIREPTNANNGYLIWSHDTLQFQWDERYLRRQQVQMYQDYELERQQREMFSYPRTSSD